MKEKYNIMDNNSSYILSNVENYMNTLNVKLNDVLDMYIAIIIEYLLLIYEKIDIKKINHFDFILIRGLETISNVFKFILFFTKNTTLAHYHSQKAFYLYIEFIEQISVDHNSFLKLTSRDAVIFVYKKTIFDINNEFKKNKKDESCENKAFFCDLDSYLLMYKNLLSFCLQTNEDKNICIRSYCDNLKIWSYYLNNNIIYSKEIIECVALFLQTMEHIIHNNNNNNNNNEYNKYIDEFVIKLVDKKNNINMYENIKKNLINITTTNEEPKMYLKDLFTII
jgi:hypothetical protein